MKAEKREESLIKTFWKLAHAKRAVFHALTTCDFYLDNVGDDDNHPMHVPLIASICVMYSRPFTDNQGVGMISSKFRQHSDERLQRTHDLLWESRKRFYAHSDATVASTSTTGRNEALQPIDVVVTRQRGAMEDRDLFTFGYNLHEMRLRGIVIPDVRDLCVELDRQLETEIAATMEQLFSPKLPDFSQLLEQAGCDQIFVRVTHSNLTKPVVSTAPQG
ncbi:MAG: hypothetical protein DLM73_01015 [Chthoniobacterales bacterium]|nr:MAG: hypothetical protein DLM73_01015 [Chthoniobacterales bacterium]